MRFLCDVCYSVFESPDDCEGEVCNQCVDGTVYELEGETEEIHA